AKWLLRAEKAGHTGTLDPLATGVLPLCFGAATKFSQLHLDADKSYHAVARLGITTLTGDAEGDAVLERPVHVDAAAVERVQALFSGPISQVPPMHSALKKDGKPLYEYARAGIEVAREARNVTIHDLQLALNHDDGVWSLDMQVRCSKGTYIRTLAQDIGEALGCGAHLTLLRRTATGSFGLKECVSLEALTQMPEAERLAQLRPVADLLQDHVPVSLEPPDAGRFLSGVRRRGAWPDNPRVAVFGQSPHALLGTAHVQAGELIPDRLLSPPEIEQILAGHPMTEIDS
ncbi:MAG: tRNA pseudouridine(55) synthase TruB, partial [Burkholderiaceae bacterium]